MTKEICMTIVPPPMKKSWKPDLVLQFTQYIYIYEYMNICRCILPSRLQACHCPFVINFYTGIIFCKKFYADEGVRMKSSY